MIEPAPPSSTPSVSQDAAIALALAQTAVPFATSREDEAERWLRVLRMHGQVGCAMQALGVSEAPLETPAQPKAVRLLRRRPLGDDVVESVARCAGHFARGRGSDVIGTADVLFAVLDVYGQAFDRALYLHGTERGELLGRLGAGGAYAAAELDSSAARDSSAAESSVG